METHFIDIHTHRIREEAVELYSVRIGSGEAVPPHVKISAGIHPWDVEKADDSWLTEIRSLNPAAIGETGLDFAAGTDRTLQREWFVRQVDLAEQMGVPVIIHCVRAYNELSGLMRGRKIPAVVHGFNGSGQLAAQLLREGFYLSFGEGVSRSPKTADALKSVPAERLFLETDQSPLGIDEIYGMAAVVRQCTLDTLKAAIQDNYDKIFSR